jgi:hypothetical protein
MTSFTVPNSLIVAIDFGGSATKAIYTLSEPHQVPSSLIMAPEVIRVSPTQLEIYSNTQMVAVQPENRAWIKVGQDYWAVGNFAKRFHAHAGLNQPKFERAVYKTLAAIWTLQQRLQLPKQFELSLSCVLPPNEYADRDRIERQIRSALNRFLTPNGLLKVKLERFDCQPEGAGIAIHYANVINTNFAAQHTAIAMLGHRNASVIAFNQGVISVFKSSNLGFIRCLEQIEQQTSGQTPERLLPAIVEWIASKDESAFAVITRSSNHRSQETKQLVRATQQARKDYIQTLVSWLRETVPNSVDEWVFAGGTTNLIAPELVNHFSDRISFHAEIEVPEAVDSSKYGHRLSDVWALFQYACSQHLQQHSA